MMDKEEPNQLATEKSDVPQATNLRLSPQPSTRRSSPMSPKVRHWRGKRWGGQTSPAFPVEAETTDPAPFADETLFASTGANTSRHSSLQVPRTGARQLLRKAKASALATENTPPINHDNARLPHLEEHEDHGLRTDHTNQSLSCSRTMTPEVAANEADIADLKRDIESTERPHKSSTIRNKSPREKKDPTPHSPIHGNHQLTDLVNSPGSGPYALSQRFTISPSRTPSTQGKSAFTFNIRARVSPSKKSGQSEDHEIFLTATIDSDHSSNE